MTTINLLDTFITWIEAIVKWVSDAPDTVVATYTRQCLLFILEQAIKWVLVTIYALWLIIRLVAYTLCIYVNQWLTTHQQIKTA